MNYGTRSCKHCQKVFEKRAPIDTYCSPQCFYDAKKKRDEGKDKKPKTIKRVSGKRQKQEAAYSVARDLFLQKEENKFCPVMAKLKNKTVPATEVHHTNGREGERLNDQEYWIGVSREGHQWIHANPKLAYEAGWLTKDYYEQILEEE